MVSSQNKNNKKSHNFLVPHFENSFGVYNRWQFNKLRITLICQDNCDCFAKKMCVSINNGASETRLNIFAPHWLKHYCGIFLQR